MPSTSNSENPSGKKISGKSGNPPVAIKELRETMSGLGAREPDAVRENPVEAFSIASRLAADGGYDLMVIGSVYLVGDLFRHMAESNGWNLSQPMHPQGVRSRLH